MLRAHQETKAEEPEVKESKEEVEEKEFQRVLHDYRANQTDIIANAEGFLRHDKQAASDFRLKINFPTALNQERLTKWILTQRPIHLQNPDELSAREVTLLALLYNYGIVVKKDLHQAFTLFKLATERGDEVAQTKLAGFYREGCVTNKDIPMARHHLSQADEKGDVCAANGLGYLFETELKDMRSAVAYQEKGARQNDPAGLFNFGLCYRLGAEVSKNPDTAFKWLSKAVTVGNPRAFSVLGNCYAEGAGVSKSPGRAAVCYRIAMQLLMSSKDQLSMAEERLLILFHENPADPRVNFQTFLTCRDNAKHRETIQVRYQAVIPYAPEIVKQLFSLPLAELEKMDAFGNEDIERVAITWNVLMAYTRFADGAFTNIILEYQLPIPEMVNQIIASEKTARDAKEKVSAFSFFKNLIRKNPLELAQEFKMSHQRARFLQ